MHNTAQHTSEVQQLNCFSSWPLPSVYTSLLPTNSTGVSIELHAPTSSTQKLKLMGRGGQFTYIPTLPLTWRLPQALDVE